MADQMPVLVRPMLASSGNLPDDTARWGLELKWDGVRVIVYVDRDTMRATGRNGTEVAARYPELRALADLLPGQRAVLDGEVVAFDAGGRPSFERLQNRMHVVAPDPRLVRRIPAHYVVFDLLYLDGHLLYDLPYADRRDLLDGLELTAGPIEAPPYLPGADSRQSMELMRLTKEQRLEGVLAKRLDSPYRPGRRVDYWRKVKNFHTQEVVIGGWKPGKGRREGRVGSLLLGVYDERGLRFVGHVGTGFTETTLTEITELLRPLRRETSPYAEEVPREFARDAHWVRPELVGEVAYSAWTQEGRLRTPSWRGLREDKNPEEVTREP